MQDSLNCDRKSNGRWTHEQHLTFLQGLRIYGKNWKKIQQLIQTRSGTQIRSHAQKFFMKLDQKDPKNKDNLQGTDVMDVVEQQQQTENSKIMNAADATRQSSSFYLNKILEHSTDYGLDDFWTALVDWKHQSDNKQSKTLRHSFQIYSKPSRQGCLLDAAQQL